MSRVGLIVGLFALLFGTTSFGQEVEEKVGAYISMNKVVHSYGVINQGDDGSCIFVVTNTGTEPLILSRCKQSCGCTVPHCPQKPIAPGESVDIKVEYDTNRVGPINKSVTISSNAVNEPTLVIMIKGDVKANTKTKPSENAPQK